MSCFASAHDPGEAGDSAHAAEQCVHVLLLMRTWTVKGATLLRGRKRAYFKFQVLSWGVMNSVLQSANSRRSHLNIARTAGHRSTPLWIPRREAHIEDLRSRKGR